MHAPWEVHDPPPDPVLTHVLSRERQEALVECIEQLEPGIRDVVVCRYLYDMAIVDIAAALHLTRSQVDNRLSRGRQALIRQWEGAASEEGGHRWSIHFHCRDRGGLFRSMRTKPPSDDIRRRTSTPACGNGCPKFVDKLQLIAHC